MMLGLIEKSSSGGYTLRIAFKVSLPLWFFLSTLFSSIFTQLLRWQSILSPPMISPRHLEVLENCGKTHGGRLHIVSGGKP